MLISSLLFHFIPVMGHMHKMTNILDIISNKCFVVKYIYLQSNIDKDLSNISYMPILSGYGTIPCYDKFNHCLVFLLCARIFFLS